MYHSYAVETLKVFSDYRPTSVIFHLIGSSLHFAYVSASLHGKTSESDRHPTLILALLTAACQTDKCTFDGGPIW